MAKVDLASALKASVAPVEPIVPVSPELEGEQTATPAAVVVATTEEADVAAEAEAVDEPNAEGEAVAVATSAGESKAPRKSKPRARGEAKKPVLPASSPAATPPADEISDKPIPLELNPSLDARLQAYRSSSRKSHHTILLDAIEATYNDLPGLIRAALGLDESEPEKVSVFGRAPRTTAPLPTDDDGRRVRHTVRVTESNRSLIDQLALDFGAPSRNFLVTTAYEAYLPQLP